MKARRGVAVEICNNLKKRPLKMRDKKKSTRKKIKRQEGGCINGRCPRRPEERLANIARGGAQSMCS